MKNRRHFFTLLEIMLGIGLILIAGGLIGFRMHKAVEKKRFSANLDRLKARCVLCQKLSIAMDSDWIGTLKPDEKGWVFELECVDTQKVQPFTPLKLEPFIFTFNDEKASGIAINFFSTGQVFPEGSLQFSSPPDLKEEWILPEIFHRDEGSGHQKIGPVHPSEN